MKGKTKLQTTDLHCSSLDTLPLSTSTLTLCPFHKTCSNAEQVLFTDEQIRSTNGKLRPAVEQVSSTGERTGISLNLVSAFFGFLFPQRFVKDRRRRRCGNCGKAGAFFAEAFPNSLWKSSRRSRRRLPCSISTAAAVSTARCRPAQGCVWRGGNRCRSPMPGIVPDADRRL